MLLSSQLTENTLLVKRRTDVAIGLQFRRGPPFGVKQFVEARREEVGYLSGIRSTSTRKGTSDDRPQSSRPRSARL